ncbi:MAG: MFS transporter, partial [Candidatus Melainabacteria bacterium]|nr:MFS transporter [Candidatus Melainabacteria bacterium]
MTRLQLRILLSVGFAQFFAGFCTLGLAPFFALLLSSLKVESGADRFLLAVGSAGMLYHFPNFCGAWTAPFWGRLGDRYGRKPLLLRAQIGLFLAFGMAALSTHLWQFVLALGLQGLLGGTYAATRAYL